MIGCKKASLPPRFTLVKEDCLINLPLSQCGSQKATHCSSTPPHPSLTLTSHDSSRDGGQPPLYSQSAPVERLFAVAGWFRGGFSPQRKCASWRYLKIVAANEASTSFWPSVAAAGDKRSSVLVRHLVGRVNIDLHVSFCEYQQLILCSVPLVTFWCSTPPGISIGLVLVSSIVGLIQGLPLIKCCYKHWSC